MKITRQFSALLFALACSMSVAAALPVELKQLSAGQWRMYETTIEAGNSAPCCIEFKRGKAQREGSLCRLESNNWSFSRSDRDVDSQLRVYLRGDGKGGMDRVRAYGASCAIEEKASAIARIELTPAAQLELLQQLTTQPGEANEELRKQAISVLALTAGAPAAQALVALTAPEQPMEVRRDAVFWLTQTRAQLGFDAVHALVKDPQTPNKLREHAVFALSQSEVAARDAALIALSRDDQSVKIRGEALFWLAQVSPEAAEPVLLAAVRDSHKQLREKAIFGLSQLDEPRAVATLSMLAKDQTLPRETRKQALFWLSQTDQSEALPELERLLGLGS